MSQINRANKQTRPQTAMRPTTPEQWQDAVDSAHALLTIEAARIYGLVTGGPEVNVERCVEILEDGRAQGILPQADAINQFLKGYYEGENHEQRNVIYSQR